MSALSLQAWKKTKVKNPKTLPDGTAITSEMNIRLTT
jgi:hypothetical protein